jgi:hypothetical protein
MVAAEIGTDLFTILRFNTSGQDCSDDMFCCTQTAVYSLVLDERHTSEAPSTIVANQFIAAAYY